MRRSGMSVLLALTLLMSAVSGAAATGGVVDHFKASDSFDLEEEFLSEACGVPVVASGRETLDVRVFADGSVKDHLVLKQTFSSEFGAVGFDINSIIHFDPDQFVDNGDGTGTVSLPHSENVMIRIQEPGSKPTAIAAGRIVWGLELTIHLESGEVVAVNEEVLRANGQFELMEQSALDLICAVLSG